MLPVGKAIQPGKPIEMGKLMTGRDSRGLMNGKGKKGLMKS